MPIQSKTIIRISVTEVWNTLKDAGIATSHDRVSSVMVGRHEGEMFLDFYVGESNIETRAAKPKSPRTVAHPISDNVMTPKIVKDMIKPEDGGVSASELKESMASIPNRQSSEQVMPGYDPAQPTLKCEKCERVDCVCSQV